MGSTTRMASVSLAVVLACGLGAGPVTAQTCGGKAITCGQTIAGRLGNGSCVDPSNGGFFDAYTFNGTAGEQLTATISTSENAEILEALITSIDFANTTPSAFASAQANTAAFTVTLNQTSPNLYLVATSVDASLQVIGVPTSYSLSLACAGLTGCTSNSETLCLNSGRFKVQAAFTTSGQAAAPAQAVTLSDGSGYLWFFQPTSAEALVKVIDGCALNGHYWVFASGLTNVKVVLTVTDSKTSQTRRYTNPQNTVFQPIEDTSAFATCP